MPSDVEMLDPIENQSSIPSTPPRSSRTSSVGIDLLSIHHSLPPLPPPPPINPSSKPVSTAPAKPKSSKSRPRSPSPSPPPPPPPPLQTVRLEIRLGGPDNYEVDISNLAKASGQRPPTPVPLKRDTSDSEGPPDDPDGKTKSKKKKKKVLGNEYYDLADPFIDDSELAVDERTFFAQTKQQGFYVSSGEVALLKDKTPKKPKSKRQLAAEPAAISLIKQEGTKDSPIALLSDADEDQTGQKRKRYLTVMEGGKRRKIVDVHSFHPELQAAVEALKQAIAKESWETKGKFPPTVKPILGEVAVKAICLDEYDEHFFNLMPSLFPYNKFTMTKLIKRTVFPEHTRILIERQDAMLEELATLTKDGFAKAQEEWEKTVVQWEKKQEKAKAEAEAETHSAESGSMDGKGVVKGAQQQQHPLTKEDGGSASGVDLETAGLVGGKEKEPPAPPSKKYRMTEAMKTIVWQLVSLSNELCRLENEKNSFEGSTVQVSEQGLRKILYQKIVGAFPEGWMSSGQISRDVSSMKKRLEKEAMENET